MPHKCTTRHLGDDDKDELVDALVHQAEEMNWIKVVTIERDGHPICWLKRSVRLSRGDEEAVVWYQGATITLVRANHAPTFDNFEDLDTFLQTDIKDEISSDSARIRYICEIQKYITRMGYRAPFLEAAFDKNFYYAYLRFIDFGLKIDEPPEFIAALALEALLRHQENPQSAIHFSWE
jgi:hypothetical protein